MKANGKAMMKADWMRITHQDRKEGEVKLIPETLEDLWHIERVLAEGDVVSAKTFRKYKASEAAEAQKKAVTVDIRVEKVEFSKFANRLRVMGKIIKAEPAEFGQQGSYHTIDVELDYPVKITKTEWKQYQIDRLSQAVKDTKKPKIAIVVLDDEKAVFATLRGYGIEYELELESSARKRDDDYEGKTASYFGEILAKLAKYDVAKIIVAGPGFTKDNLRDFIARKDPKMLKNIVFESCSYAERSGVNELMKNGIVAKVAGESRIGEETDLIEKFKLQISKDSGLAVYGQKEVAEALEASALGELLVLDELLRKNKEIEKILEASEKRKVKITIFSHESDPGHELAGFSGIAGILRFRMR